MNLPQPETPEWQKPVMFYGKPLTFNPRNHRYTWDGKPVPSVTTIIGRLNKPLLIQWAANCAVESIRHDIEEMTDAGLLSVNWSAVFEKARKAHLTKKEDAADIGIRVHHYARGILEGKTPPEPLDGPAQKAIVAFWRWVESHKIEPLAVERRVMSAEHMYAGTCDFDGFVDDRIAVLDFKTGNGVYDEAWWQTSGYDLALREDHPNRPRAVRWIIHLNKTTGEMTAHCRDSAEDYDQDMAVWLSLLQLDKALRAARKHPKKVA